MTELKKTAEISIRLPKQASLPKPAELIEMAHEARRSKKRIEMPWQPEGRPHPALISVHFDDKINKSTWSIHNSHLSEAKVDWSEIDPDPTKVILALRDWYTRVRDTEGWYKGSPLEPLTFDQDPRASGTMPTIAPVDPSMSGAMPTIPHVDPRMSGAMPAIPHGDPSQSGAMPTIPGGYPGYPQQQPYPQTPGGVPVWTGYPQQPYPNYAVPPAPQHWAQSAPAAPGTVPGDQPLAPELWALHAQKSGAQAVSPKLGDLLVAAGVIPTQTLQAALTLQNTNNIDKRKIGEILVKTGALPQKVLEAAVKLQDMAREKTITNQRVTELLRQIHSSGCTLDELLKKSDKVPLPLKTRADQMLEDEEAKITTEERKKVTQVLAILKGAELTKSRSEMILELLQKASVISEATLEAESKATKGNVVDTVKALLVKEHVDPTTFEAALACQKLIKDERFKIEQAVIALGYCSRSRVSLKDAITDLNWLIPLD